MKEFIEKLDAYAKAYSDKEARRIVDDWRRNKQLPGGDINIGYRLLVALEIKRQEAAAKLSQAVRARKRVSEADAELAKLKAARERIAKARDKFE